MPKPTMRRWRRLTLEISGPSKIGSKLPFSEPDCGPTENAPISAHSSYCYWIENNTYSQDEIAVRFHHRLTLIHPFPNRNGRHARLIADMLLMKLGRPAFTWGYANLVKEGEARMKYLEAIRAADKGDIQPLLKFARS